MSPPHGIRCLAVKPGGDRMTDRDREENGDPFFLSVKWLPPQYSLHTSQERISLLSAPVRVQPQFTPHCITNQTTEQNILYGSPFISNSLGNGQSEASSCSCLCVCTFVHVCICVCVYTLAFLCVHVLYVHLQGRYDCYLWERLLGFPCGGCYRPHWAAS